MVDCKRTSTSKKIECVEHTWTCGLHACMHMYNIGRLCTWLTTYVCVRDTCCTARVDTLTGYTRVLQSFYHKLPRCRLCIEVFRKSLTFVFVMEKNPKKDELKIPIPGVYDVRYKICIHIILFGKKKLNLEVTENKPKSCKIKKQVFATLNCNLFF